MRRHLRAGFTLPELGITLPIVFFIFSLVFGFLVRSTRTTGGQTDRLSTVQALVMMRTMMLQDLGRNGPEGQVQVPSPSEVQIMGPRPASYLGVAGGARLGELYRLEAGSAPKRVGPSFRGRFESRLDSARRELVLALTPLDLSRGTLLKEAPTLELRFSLDKSMRAPSQLVGRFRPVLRGGGP